MCAARIVCAQSDGAEARGQRGSVHQGPGHGSPRAEDPLDAAMQTGRVGWTGGSAELAGLGTRSRLPHIRHIAHIHARCNAYTHTHIPMHTHIHM